MIEKLHEYKSVKDNVDRNHIKESNSYMDYIPFWALKQEFDLLKDTKGQTKDDIYNSIYEYFQVTRDLTYCQRYTLPDVEFIFQTNTIISNWFRLRNYREGIYSAFDLEVESPMQSMYSNNKQFTTLFSLVIPIKYVTYVIMFLILEEPIDLRVYEFWIREGFDSKETTHTNFRRLYRKYLLPDLKNNNIPIIIKKDIDKELYFQTKLPEFKTPTLYNEYISTIIKETIEKEKLDNNILIFGNVNQDPNIVEQLSNINNFIPLNNISGQLIANPSNGLTRHTTTISPLRNSYMMSTDPVNSNIGSGIVQEIDNMPESNYIPLTYTRLQSFLTNFETGNSNMISEENLNHINIDNIATTEEEEREIEQDNSEEEWHETESEQRDSF